jgi:pimeloyl-ACP methyl ester carboxylesterase
MPYANNNGVRIHYHMEGEGSPLVIQHGFTDSMKTWYELGYVDMLKDSHRLILVDARGHGDSDKPHNPDAYRIETMASDVVTVLDELSIPKAHFIGYSMGGRMGFAIAKYAPERFHSLIIGGSSPYKGNPEARNQRLKDLEVKRAAAILEWWDTPPTPQVRSRLLENDVEALAALTTEHRDSPGDEEVLPIMTMSCLLFVGEDDPAYPRVIECANQIPNANLVSLLALNHVGAFFVEISSVPTSRSSWQRLMRW